MKSTLKNQKPRFHAGCYFVGNPDGASGFSAAESVIFLRKVAESGYNHLQYRIRRRGIELANLYQKLQPEIIDQQIDADHLRIAEKLDAALYGRIAESHRACEKETGKKGYNERYQEREYGCRYHHYAEVGVLFPQYKVETKPVQHYTEQRVRATDRRVPESLQGHETERFDVEQVYERDQASFHLKCKTGEQNHPVVIGRQITGCGFIAVIERVAPFCRTEQILKPE